jgi:hypothetical protein
MAELGRKIEVYSSTDGTTWTQVKGLNNASMSANGEDIDITEFGDTHVNRIIGLRDNGYNLSGRLIMNDTTGALDPGQKILEDHSLGLAATDDLYIKILWDGTYGFTQKVICPSFDRQGQVRGVVEINIQLQAAGAITRV